MVVTVAVGWVTVAQRENLAAVEIEVGREVVVEVIVEVIAEVI